MKKKFKNASRCAYVTCCYLAEDLKCFGYKTDCALYMKSNGEEFSQHRFDEAMDKLINKTKAKFKGVKYPIY